MQLKDWAGAETDCRRVLELAPDNAKAHARIGRCLAEQGCVGEADSEYERARKLNPKLTELRSRWRVDAARTRQEALWSGLKPNPAFVVTEEEKEEEEEEDDLDRAYEVGEMIAARNDSLAGMHELAEADEEGEGGGAVLFESHKGAYVWTGRAWKTRTVRVSETGGLWVERTGRVGWDRLRRRIHQGTTRRGNFYVGLEEAGEGQRVVALVFGSREEQQACEKALRQGLR